MKVTFVSNFINHHQLPFSEEMYKILGEDYCFIETKPMEEERKSMGWEEVKPAYVKRYYEDEDECRKIIRDCDVAIFGWTEVPGIEEERLFSGKLSFRMSERIYREGQWKFISPKGLVAKYMEHIRYRKAPYYLLCTGAYVASDFDLINAYPGKKLKFGYFPPSIAIDDIDKFIEEKESDVLHIFWAGRFISLKHPEYALRACAKLKERGVAFHLHMIGDGELKDAVSDFVIKNDLKNEVTLYGYRTPDEVRKIMSRCQIGLFTSNHLEGWGAVVNEGMNSALAMIADIRAGAVPFLIKDGENGIIYDGTYEDLERKLLGIISTPKKRKYMAKKAYETTMNLWSAEYAAKEFVKISKQMLKGIYLPSNDGPLSEAKNIKPVIKGERGAKL